MPFDLLNCAATAAAPPPAAAAATAVTAGFFGVSAALGRISASVPRVSIRSFDLIFSTLFDSIPGDNLIQKKKKKEF